MVFKTGGIYLKRPAPTIVTDYSLWKTTKIIKVRQFAQPFIRSENSQWCACNDKDKSNLFALYSADRCLKKAIDVDQIQQNQAVRFKLKELRKTCVLSILTKLFEKLLF